MNPQPSIKLISRLLLAFGVMLVNGFLFTLLAGWLCNVIYHTDIGNYISLGNFINPNQTQISATRLFIAISSIGTFLVSSLVLAVIFRQKPTEYLGLSTFPKPIYFFMVPILLMVSLPFMSWLIQWNSHLQLPGFLAGLEQKLKEFEAANEGLYTLMFGLNSMNDVVINIFVMALIPAIGEELFCRGVLLNIVFDYNGKMFRSIVIVALIFTLFHLQFYKFMPMMALAILLGLFITWTQSIWVSILYHFLNNAFVVWGAHLEQKGVKNFLTDTDAQVPFYLGLLSLLATLSLLVWLNKFSKKAEI